MALTIACGAAGCASPRPQTVRADRYLIEAALDPESHRLTARATIDLTRTGGSVVPRDGTASVELLLHPDLNVRRVRASGAAVRRYYRRATARTDVDDGFTPAKHLVVLDHAADALSLFVDYDGALWQDVAAGESPDEIHNFKMRAHISPEGVYLAGGNWYPQPPDDEVNPSLADYTLLLEPVPGMEFVAGAELAPSRGSASGRRAWTSPYPLDRLVLVGGPHEVHQTIHRGIAVSAHLKPGQSELADGWLEAVRHILDRYEPLIGPYPAGEYAVVDNFFSSGFAFPTFTLLASAVINMGQRAQTTHGYLDHELLHSWWGNGVFVDPRDGNWCEALASYAANYYGSILDGNDEEARRKRRNYSHFLSRIEPEKDKPLGTYDRPDGCGRGIAYSKGAVVFHMLARTIGQENFWSAMRRLTEEYVGCYASWDDIKRLCEERSGRPLEKFFEQWVRGAGAPQLTIESARYDARTLIVAVSQTEPPFELQLPLRIHDADGQVEVTLELSTTSQEFEIPVEREPQFVELDPDFHVFRKAAPDEIIPTTNSTRHGDAFATILPSGGVPDAYRELQKIFESSFEEDERKVFTGDDLTEGDLAARSLLILGNAARHPYVRGFLTAIDFPVRWTDTGFEAAGVEYDGEGSAVLCTARHPDVAGGGVTVVYANSESAIPNPHFIPMYDRSLIVFEDGRATVRLDFEKPVRVAVQRE
jgi:hypothetical protein